MKKHLLQILFILLMFPAISQNLVSISGTVTDTATGNPIANHAVVIMNDSSAGWYYYQTVYTNINGFYVDTVPVPLNTQGILYIQAIDCQNYATTVPVTFSPSSLNFTVNFAICLGSNPCQASFVTQQQLPLNVQFTDLSIGGDTTRLWNFGDGATASQSDPVHSYALPGYYNVTLTIGAPGTTCYTYQAQTIYVWDSTGGGCQAGFIQYADTLNTLNTYHFIDQSSGNIIGWSWNFGDPASGINNLSTSQNSMHTFTSPGTYTVCLTVHGADSTCQDMTCHTLVVGAVPGCDAQFTYYADSLVSPTAVHFIDLSTSGAGAITQWVWQFGDGTSQTITFPGNPNVTHSYAQAGTYTACLMITGSDSTCYDYTCKPITVGTNSGCIANFLHSIPTSTAYPTLFEDASMAGGGGSITSWSWNFGDPASGSNNVSSLQNPSHTFTVQGTYIVCLTIQGSDSTCYDTECQTIIVEGAPGCQAYFAYTYNNAYGDHTVNFTDLSAGSPTSWLWSFGDGTSSTVQDPQHYYTAAGTYPVCLTITGNNCTDTYCKNVVILDSLNYHQVFGQVFAGNFPISIGLAMIFSMDTTAGFQPFVEVFPIDSNGVYYFSMVPDGNYYIMAIPFDSAGYLPTYYGNTINWEAATLISLGTENNPYNINLVASAPMTNGPGSAGGQINMGDVNSSMVDKVNMILMNSGGTPIGFTSVSISGAFSFPSLDYGTYFLHAEMPGVTSDQVMITITPEKPHADVVMTFSGNKILGIRDEISLVNNWLTYPNPVTDHVSVTLDMKQDVQVVAEIRNLAGQLLSGNTVRLHAGNNTISLSTATLPAGAYLLRIYSASGVNIHSKLVRTR